MSDERSIDSVDHEVFINKLINSLSFIFDLLLSNHKKIDHAWQLDILQKFYQFITNTSDKPRYEMVYKTDAPLNIRSLFYVPTSSPELFGFGKLESGVSLYSRKVLIQAKAENILPSWLRFMKGVVDSEDIPSNLSRELLQDSALIRKLSSVISAKLVRFFQDQMKKDYVKFEKFFKDYGMFFREGIVTAETQDERENIAKVLRFESSKEKPGFLKTLTQYIADMKTDQKEIFYLCIPRYVLNPCIA